MQPCLLSYYQPWNGLALFLLCGEGLLIPQHWQCIVLYKHYVQNCVQNCAMILAVLKLTAPCLISTGSNGSPKILWTGHMNRNAQTSLTLEGSTFANREQYRAPLLHAALCLRFLQMFSFSFSCLETCPEVLRCPCPGSIFWKLFLFLKNVAQVYLVLFRVYFPLFVRNCLGPFLC